MTDGVTTPVSYYSFGGLRIAVKRGSTLYHLHGDRLGSTSLTTRGSSTTASRPHYAYGAERSATGDLQTDHTFSGQKRDATGLMYYNARYYDPALGTFISPDSMVPGAGQVINYNRFLYARGNPLRYRDPSGYAPCAEKDDGCWNNRWYLAHGYRKPPKGTHWTETTQAVFLDEKILRKVLEEAGITIEEDWDISDPTEFQNVRRLAQGVVQFGQKIGELAGAGTTAGLERLKTLTGGSVTWGRASKWNDPGPLGCRPEKSIAACPSRSKIEFYDSLFGSKTVFIKGIVVHELAHVIANNYCTSVFIVFCLKGSSRHIPEWHKNLIPRAKRTGVTRHLTDYGLTNRREYWAEAVAIWAVGTEYRTTSKHITGSLNQLQVDYIEGILRP